jgi:hypothetical protein
MKYFIDYDSIKETMDKPKLFFKEVAAKYKTYKSYCHYIYDKYDYDYGYTYGYDYGHYD